MLVLAGSAHTRTEKIGSFCQFRHLAKLLRVMYRQNLQTRTCYLWAQARELFTGEIFIFSPETAGKISQLSFTISMNFGS